MKRITHFIAVFIAISAVVVINTVYASDTSVGTAHVVASEPSEVPFYAYLSEITSIISTKIGEVISCYIK